MAFSIQRVVFETLMIACAWIALLALITFSGYPMFWALKKERPGLNDIPDLFWLGFTAIIAILQIWHLFLPVSWLFLLVLIIFNAVWFFYLLSHRLLQIKKIEFSNFIAIFGIIVVGIAMANQALTIIDPWSAIVRFDMGNYHLQAIQWIKTFPIIPGLGNINYRLAYNNSIFLFDALTDNGYWENRSYYIANGIILYAGVIQAIFGLKNVIIHHNRPELKNLYFALMLAPLVFKINLISSLEPDVCIFVMSLVLAGQLIELYDKVKLDKYSIRLRLLIIASLTSVGITIKLSFVGLGVTAFGLASILAGWIWYEKNKLLVPGLIVSCLSWLFVVLTWMIRSVILGGYLAFPVVATQIPVLWQIPTSIAQNEYQWIKIFARTNDPNSTEKVLSNLDWLSLWRPKIPTDIVIAVSLLTVGIVTIVLLRILKKGLTKNIFILWAGLPFICSLVFWFINAPDIRFADGSIWALSLLVFTLGFGDLIVNLKNNFSFASLTPLIVIGLLLFFAWPEINPKLNIPGLNPMVGIHHLGLPKFHEEQTSIGLKENVPDDVLGRCWNIPLPCLPEFNNQLIQVDLWLGRPSYIISH
jgi:hypothetical protein